MNRPQDGEGTIGDGGEGESKAEGLREEGAEGDGLENGAVVDRDHSGGIGTVGVTPYSPSLGGPGSSRPVLADICLEVKRGELLCVYGPTGCGKSSLLMSILGELRRLDGTVEVGHGVAPGLVSQVAGDLPRRSRCGGVYAESIEGVCSALD